MDARFTVLMKVDLGQAAVDRQRDSQAGGRTRIWSVAVVYHLYETRMPGDGWMDGWMVGSQAAAR